MIFLLLTILAELNGLMDPISGGFSNVLSVLLVFGQVRQDWSAF